MQYFGGKAKVAEGIAQILNDRIQPGQTYVEPFCGALNVASRISGPRLMYLSDAHPHLMAMWKQAFLDIRLFPALITEDDYQFWKACPDPCNAIKGFVGFGCSFAGKWFGGYARDGRRGGVNFAQTAINGIRTKLARFAANGNTPILSCHGYETTTLSLGTEGPAMVYCDPPYRATTEYSTGGFDSHQFNVWVRGMIDAGHDVLVSEYQHNLPEGAIVVWRKESKKDIRDGAGIQATTTEILYTFPKLTLAKEN